jgi:DNA-binding Lrp family transcriptional regulator
MMGDWTFFSNYGHVLVCLAQNPEVRLRDVAQQVGITERAVQKIVRDMQDAGFITISKQGRCNRYRINKRRSLRHGLESHCTVGKLLALVSRPMPPVTSGRPLPEQDAELITPVEAVPEVSEIQDEKPVPAKKEAVASSAPTRKKETKVEKKTEKKNTKSDTGPIDTRQQGSLF